MPDSRKITEALNGLTGCFVAGGAITSLYTNKPINDFDIYPKSQEALEGAIQWAYDSNYWSADATLRSLTFSNNDEPQVQIMHFDVFPTAEHIFNAFDFTCCMGAFDLDSKQFILGDQFLVHCAQRFLKFNPGTRFPYASAWRVRKYEERGFTIGKMEFQKILMSCAERPIRSWDDLRDQIGGVYGEAFDIPDGEPFTLEAAYKAIGTLRFDKTRRGYASVEEAIVMTTTVERRWFSQGKDFYVEVDGEFCRMPAPPKCGKAMSLEEIAESLRFYKKVRKKDGKYFSHYKNSFLYPMGETVSSGEPFLYAYQSLHGAKNHYSGNGPDNPIIELKPTSASDIIFEDSGVVRLKSCLVVGEVPQEDKQAA